MENKIDLTTLPKVWDGYERQWYRCNCGAVMYDDYIPYSLSNPILITKCGHDIKNMKPIDESEINQ
ncbi:hypothetical protein U8V72_17490 [Priestia filamentosa]|uniref:hypothetical protein n=1 Tax=Priestia filamentosa TaxID=1402861 RepID=UPI000588FA06